MRWPSERRTSGSTWVVFWRRNYHSGESCCVRREQPQGGWLVYDMMQQLISSCLARARRHFFLLFDALGCFSVWICVGAHVDCSYGCAMPSVISGAIVISANYTRKQRSHSAVLK